MYVSQQLIDELHSALENKYGKNHHVPEQNTVQYLNDKIMVQSVGLSKIVLSVNDEKFRSMCKFFGSNNSIKVCHFLTKGLTTESYSDSRSVEAVMHNLDKLYTRIKGLL